MSNTENLQRNKRKRKETFLKNARKYAKKGYFGRGAHIEGDTYQFLVNSMELYKQGFDNEEDKQNFTNNILKETEGKEEECCRNQVGCRALEMLLPNANDDVLKRFMDKFGEDIRPLSSDRFAGFVLQALVKISVSKSLNAELNSDIRETYKNFALKVSKFLLNNLEDYVWDNFGNRVMRTCLCELVQIPDENQTNNSKKDKRMVVEKDIKIEAKEVPTEYVDVVKQYGQRLIVWPQFNELGKSELTSGLLQVLLKAIKQVDKDLLKKYLAKLLDESFSKSGSDGDALPAGFMSMSLIMLLETALQLTGKKMYKLYYSKLFSGKMATLAVLKSTNFSVQKVLTRCNDKEQFESMFDELANSFSEILQNGTQGVLLALGQGCKRLSTKQALFVQNLMKALNCFEPEENQNSFVLCMCRLKPYNTLTPAQNLEKERFNLQGTLMIQLMLEFNKPIKIVNSILNMDTTDLKSLFGNTMGSHIVDSYVSSAFVGEKSREKLVRKMMGTYQSLAATKYGSRSFEGLWKAASLKFKLQIMEELAYKDASWSKSEFGRIIASKVNLDLFKANKENWKSSLNKQQAEPKEQMAGVLK